MKKIITPIVLFFGITVACMASEAGGIHPSLDEFSKKMIPITAILKVKVNGFERKDITKVTMDKRKENKKSYGSETVYNSDNFKKVIIDVSLIETISYTLDEKLDEKQLKQLTFSEPFFSHSYIILPDGKKKNVMHTLGYEYSSSGKEFTDQICGGGNIIFLFLLHDEKGKMEIIRAEPFTKGTEEKITKPYRVGKKEDSEAPNSIPKLIIEATTRPWPGKNFPELPGLPQDVVKGATKEIESSPDIKKAYAKLDATKQKNVTWFKGVEELKKQKAVYCLLTALCHPHEDVQIHAIKALGPLADPRSLPFLITYANAMAVYEDGSENATIHGIIHKETAKTLSAITRLKFRVPSGQDPKALKYAIYQCQKWQLNKKKITEKAFGKAKIKIGMTKDEILKQIDLSQSQYRPLDSEKSIELYIGKPDAETIERNEWMLNCPTRNSRFRGGGSGIRMRLVFEKDKLKKIAILPWLAG